ncbi:MAG TPA: ATP-binding protein [Bdellovibrionota bacterium]|nr:ATP-binding protein [Bdellovibrionota bacterium]
MSDGLPPRSDERVEAALATLTKMAAGEIGLRLPVSENRDVLDAFSFAINMMAAELGYQQKLRLEQAEAAREAAEQASRLKSQFLANMSHELRTPLSAILGLAEVMSAMTVDPGERDDCARRIRENGQVLLHLIDDILDLAKVEAGRLRIEVAPVELDKLVSQVLADHLPRSAAKGLALEVVKHGELPAILRTDGLRLRQILSNLLGNAIKFTDGGRVELGLRHEPSPSVGRLVVEVSDTGPGMDAHEASRLFEPFVQLDATSSRRLGGAGLGLALSRHLAQLLGGDLELVSTEPGRGSRFRLTVQCAYETADASPKPRAAPTPRAAKDPRVLAGCRVLLVDDAADNRLVYSAFLRRAGAAVESVSDGGEALTLWQQGSFDAVILDLQMPGMDGYECLRQLRTLGCKAPVVALTAHVVVEARRRTATAGFDAYLTKPVGGDALAGEIRVLIDRFKTKNA